MPLERCKLPGGKMGWKVKNVDKCWRSKRDAIRQWYAIDPDEVKKELSTNNLHESLRVNNEK